MRTVLTAMEAENMEEYEEYLTQHGANSTRQKWSCIMKRPKILVAIGALSFVALTISVTMTVITTLKYVGNPKICDTPGCVHAAYRVLEYIDPEIKPCDNFYDFACGGYMKTAPIPDDAGGIEQLSMLSIKIQKELKAVLEEPSSPDEQRPFTLAKNFYRACTNLTHLEQFGLQPLRKVLDRFIKWPVLEGDNWNGDDFDWLQSNSTNFFEFVVTIDFKNSSKYMLLMSPSIKSQNPSTNGTRSPAEEDYLNIMIKVAVRLGADPQRAKQELEESLDFQIKLANISLPEEELQNKTRMYNPMTVAELNTRYPSVNWTEYLTNMLPSEIHVDSSDIVVVNYPNYISSLEELIKNTPKRVQANYLGQKIVAKFLLYLPESLQRELSKYDNALSNVERENNPRWKGCLAILATTPLSLSANALYVRKHFKEEARQNVVEMVADIRNELMNILRKADWIDEQTRSSAMDKVTSIFSHIAHPVELLDDKILAEFFASLEMSPVDFYGNIQNIDKFDDDVNFKKLKEPVNKTEWTTHAKSTESNAFYAPNENSIQIPAGILQRPFFDDDQPRYMNYGAIGYIVGHEVTHSFDTKGRQYDKDGNLVDWWTPETAQKYSDKAQCLIDQYSNYTVNEIGLNVNGNQTLSENIADNGGLKEAYHAYKDYVRRNGPESKLPGVHYTPEQMFWISSAQVWCVRYRPEAVEKLKLVHLSDPHSPHRFRVIGTVSNSPEFAADFKCPLGSNMNPVHKCSLI